MLVSNGESLYPAICKGCSVGCVWKDYTSMRPATWKLRSDYKVGGSANTGDFRFLPSTTPTHSAPFTTLAMSMNDITNTPRARQLECAEQISTFKVMADGTCHPTKSWPRRAHTPPPPRAVQGYGGEPDGMLPHVTWSPDPDDLALPPPLWRLQAPLDWHERFPPLDYWFSEDGVPLELRIMWHGPDHAYLLPFFTHRVAADVVPTQELRSVTPDTVLAWHEAVAAYASQREQLLDQSTEGEEDEGPQQPLVVVVTARPATPNTLSNLTPAAATAPTANPLDASGGSIHDPAGSAVREPRREARWPRSSAESARPTSNEAGTTDAY
ncbi:hypothetical protein AURDEDRAFT_125746 [Auricularia subglabra TFB-10046 SS5]|nr:hypothetical protein AURDEDRAFT_125746 [Auricularia subglabra TFB-10046 SS5]